LPLDGPQRLIYNSEKVALRLPSERKRVGMARLIDAVLAVWRIRRNAQSGQKISLVLVLEILAAVVALFFPIVGQIVLTVDILFLHVNTREKLAWIFFIWVMPFVGPLLYLLVGPRRTAPPPPMAGARQ
jgi:phospholipase D-like protein